MSEFNISRRDFLKSSVIGSSMLLTIQLPAAGKNSKTNKLSEDWCVYVHIDQENQVTIYSPVADAGQHMKTTGPMILAEEMDLDWSLTRVADDCPTYLMRNAEGRLGYKYSNMSTGGSHAVRRNWDYMRRAGATVRQMMLEEASELLKVPVDSLKASMSHVIHVTSGKSISYGLLAQGAASRKVDTANLKLKSVNDYQIMGKDAKTVDLEQIVTGKPLYGLDEDYDNAVQVVIHRAPWLGATVKGFNKSAAMSIPGVIDVIKIDRHVDNAGTPYEKQIISAGVAVIAENLWAAIRGKQVLATEWLEDPAFKDENSEAQQVQFKQLVLGNTKGTIRNNVGDVDAAFTSSEKVLDQIYELPLLAHACMEPFNCIADIREHDATVIVGHQFPDIVASEVERFTDIDGLKVEVINKRMGGGFGRRYERDFVREAVFLSKQLKRPVKVTWMREDEIERDYFAPAHTIRIKAALDKDNKVSAWYHRQSQTAGGCRDECFPADLVENYRTEVIDSGSRIPTGPWRGPAHLQWTFAVESMTDELAYLAGEDPLDFRLKMLMPHKAYEYKGFGATLIDSGRMAKCYESAAKLAGWGRKLARGHGLGIAGHFTFGSYAAFVLEVAIDDDEQLISCKAWGAIDCGFAINPNHIRNQMEGGFIEGLNAALFNKIEVERGRVINNNFHSLRWMKMREAPLTVEVDIINNDYPPTGVGEPPTAPAAAALANAVYAATGRRIRKLPMMADLKV